MSNPREVAANLYKTALTHNVRFPKIWDESKCIQSCGAILVSSDIKLLIIICIIIVLFRIPSLYTVYITHTSTNFHVHIMFLCVSKNINLTNINFFIINFNRW